jgi:hypothetical protein
MDTPARTLWSLEGTGYEFCNCDFGCGCNFGGFPNSKDGSCQAFVGMRIHKGQCGDVRLDGLTCASLLSWPKAIHEGNGRCVFIVEPETSQEQIDALAGIFSGQLGGMPWEILATTFEVVGLERARISIEGEGVKSSMRVEGIGEAKGDCFRNPVTGDEHHATVELPDGFIWSRGKCGTGTFHAKAGPISLSFAGTNWINYTFGWSNRPAA